MTEYLLESPRISGDFFIQSLDKLWISSHSHAAEHGPGLLVVKLSSSDLLSFRQVDDVNGPFEFRWHEFMCEWDRRESTRGITRWDRHRTDRTTESVGRGLKFYIAIILQNDLGVALLVKTEGDSSKSYLRLGSWIGARVSHFVRIWLFRKMFTNLYTNFRCHYVMTTYKMLCKKLKALRNVAQ